MATTIPEGVEIQVLPAVKRRPRTWTTTRTSYNHAATLVANGRFVENHDANVRDMAVAQAAVEWALTGATAGPAQDWARELKRRRRNAARRERARRAELRSGGHEVIRDRKPDLWVG